MIYRTKVDKLTISNSKGDYQSYVWVAPSEQGGTTGLGQLFIIVEIKSREKKIPMVLNQIVEELSEYYYHSPTKNTEAALETTAQYFNENVVDIAGKNLKWVREKMSILVAAVQENKLILSNYNKIKVWMLRDNKIHDVTSGQGESQKSMAGKKILSQLISGQLIDGDVLLLTNSTIFDYFSDEKIKKTISTLAPTQACAFFKNTLLDYKVGVDFSTIIIKFSEFKKEERLLSQSAKGETAVDEGIEELNRTEPKMLGKVAKSIGAGIKKGLGQTGQKVGELIKPRLKTKAKRQGEEVKQERREKDTGQAPPEGLMQPTDDKGGRWARWLAKFKKWKTINRVEYRLVVLILIVGALFAGSLAVVNNRQESQQKNEEFQGIVAEINDKLNSMEAALIYKDETRAQELLGEARELLGSLPQDNAQQQYTYLELKDSVEAQVGRIYKLDKIENPEILAVLPPGFNPTSNIYISNKDIIYAARGGEVYKLNSESKSMDKVAEIQGQIKQILDFETSRILLVTSRNETWLLDTGNDSTRQVSFSLPTDESVIGGMATYAQKLYVLDEGQNNIYKYSYNTSSFSNPTAWLEGAGDIAGNISIVVDGNIWLSAKDGQIDKFFKGKEEVFSLKGAYEPVSAQTVLYTADSLDNLYLLDRSNNRIYIADKQGKITQQLLGDELEDIVSIVPNANEQEIYVMTGERVYKVGW